MRRYLSRLLGTLIGLSGGWYGVIVGFLVGTLFDTLLESRRRSRGVELFLREGRAPRKRSELWILAALATRLTTLEGAPIREQIQGMRSYLGRHFELRNSQMEEIIDSVALHPRVVNENALLQRWVALGEERKLWPEEVVCWFYELAGERKDGIRPGEREWIRWIGRRIGLGESQLATIEAEAPFLEEEAAAILGVPRSADREQLRRVYRRLAAQFHPDTAVVLAEEQRRSSEGAFVKIRDAYERLMNHLEELDREHSR
ncbi:MAG: DnaJ domain-containing protein [Alkalispirochaetaceae bacterium]